MECRRMTQPVVDSQWMSVLGKQHGNKFIVCDEFKMQSELRDEIEINYNMEDATMEMRFHAVSNGLMERTKLEDVGNQLILMTK